jgi:hypothetical protein
MKGRMGTCCIFASYRNMWIAIERRKQEKKIAHGMVLRYYPIDCSDNMTTLY